MTRQRRLLLGAVAALAALTGCRDGTAPLERSADAAVATTSTSSPSSTTTSTTSTTSTTMPPAPTTTIPRVVTETGYGPFATVGGVTLHHPGAAVERIGFHESGHDGARQLEVAPGAVRPVTLETRDRGTGSRTAADIVVPPDSEIRVPVTGTVKRAGGYILYCQHHDDFAVIEPDAHPGWEVKIFHIDGVQVRTGDRVEAGVTVVAPRSTVLPFESQVDEFTATPSWPHVHVEVIDPSIPNKPSPGEGCS